MFLKRLLTNEYTPLVLDYSDSAYQGPSRAKDTIKKKTWNKYSYKDKFKVTIS